MEIKIHRGLEQIGGCITEISTETSRIFIDFGQNLPGIAEPTTPGEDAEYVGNILSKNQKEYEAVFYSHIHEDHVGLFPFIPWEMPQYMGEGAKELLKLKYTYIQQGNRLSYITNKSEEIYERLRDYKRKKLCIKHFKTWKRTQPGETPKPIQIGDIRVTPFFTCHSVYDAYMFLIEADGKRIWHTGDFRGHGYLSKGLFPTLQKYATNIDTLIIEGTMLNSMSNCLYEREIACKMSEVMDNQKYVFVLASSTDIERLATINMAAKQSQKDLYVSSDFTKDAMDLYTKREAKVSKGLFDFHPILFKDKLLPQMVENGFVMVISASQLRFLNNFFSQTKFPYEKTLIYSTWDGYYKYPEQYTLNSTYKDLHESQLFSHVFDIHTSGHADRNTIKKVIETINPREQIIGIHKEAYASLKSLDLADELKQKITYDVDARMSIQEFRLEIGKSYLNEIETSIGHLSDQVRYFLEKKLYDNAFKVFRVIELLQNYSNVNEGNVLQLKQQMETVACEPEQTIFKDVNLTRDLYNRFQDEIQEKDSTFFESIVWSMFLASRYLYFNMEYDKAQALIQDAKTFCRYTSHRLCNADLWLLQGLIAIQHQDKQQLKKALQGLEVSKWRQWESNYFNVPECVSALYLSLEEIKRKEH